jgi:hypothetical protein
MFESFCLIFQISTWLLLLELRVARAYLSQSRQLDEFLWALQRLIAKKSQEKR